MSYRKKFHFRGLKPKQSFADSTQPVLSHHFDRVYDRSDQYRREPTEENLHDLRIALRRFRYVLELYAGIIKPARFEEIYELAVSLQNVLGERRDLDVMRARLDLIYREADAEFPNLIAADLARNRELLDLKIQETLTQFTENKQIRKVIGH